MTTVVADNEQQRDEGTIRHPEHDVDRQAKVRDRTEECAEVEQDVDGKKLQSPSQRTRVGTARGGAPQRLRGIRALELR